MPLSPLSSRASITEFSFPHVSPLCRPLPPPTPSAGRSPASHRGCPPAHRPPAAEWSFPRQSKLRAPWLHTGSRRISSKIHLPRGVALHGLPSPCVLRRPWPTPPGAGLLSASPSSGLRPPRLMPARVSPKVLERSVQPRLRVGQEPRAGPGLRPVLDFLSLFGGFV